MKHKSISTRINRVIRAGFVLDSVVNASDDDNPAVSHISTSTLDEDNGNAHIYAATANPLTSVYTYTDAASGGVQIWSAVSAAFQSAQGAPTPSPTPTP